MPQKKPEQKGSRMKGAAHTDEDLSKIIEEIENELENPQEEGSAMAGYDSLQTIDPDRILSGIYYGDHISRVHQGNILRGTSRKYIRY